MGEVHDEAAAPAVAPRAGPSAKHVRSDSGRSSSSRRTSSGRPANSPHPSTVMSSAGSASVTPAHAGTPDVQEGATLAAPAAPELPADVRSPLTKGLLSDSKWEIEIAEFSHILDDMLTRVTCRELVKHTAEYLKKFPQHSVRFQIKMKQVTHVVERRHRWRGGRIRACVCVGDECVVCVWLLLLCAGTCAFCVYLKLLPPKESMYFFSSILSSHVVALTS